MNGNELDLQGVNALRTLSIDAVQKANSGHPGLPLGAAPMAYVLWKNHLKHDPSDPTWPDRDRFVLSAGHGSALLYSLLHVFGYDLNLDDLKAFRQWGSRTPGHPEVFHTAGVEATTGPLGQGSANVVGMAMAERLTAHRLNASDHELISHWTYALVSDGDLMEGISNEAASLAGHLGLGKLIYLYDSNHVSLDGPTSLSFTEDSAKRYESLGWHVLHVDDGDNDLDAIDAALIEAKAETARPSMIVVHTTIGFGSPHKAGSSAAHGSPLGEEEVRLTKKALGCDPELTFYVPPAVQEEMKNLATRCGEERAAWEEKRESWAAEHPEEDRDWRRALACELPDDWEGDLPSFETGEKVATRKASGMVLNAIAKRVPWLVGGDADLSGSTKTHLDGEESFDAETGAGRNIHFGVREHTMGAIANGMGCYGGFRAYTATFFVFSDYMRPAMRIAALCGLPSIFVFTHDSIAVGEDGPTHQPIEHLMSLRVMPNLHVIRPMDANETIYSWTYAMKRVDGPTVLVFSRQGLLTVDRGQLGAASGLERGAYVLADSEGGEPQAIILATGSEVGVALEARETLEKDGVPTRVVSIPCFEAFEAQDAAYREEVLPAGVTARVAVEAGSTLGWERYTGTSGATVGLDRFGASSPGDVNLEKLGMTSEAVVEAVKGLL